MPLHLHLIEGAVKDCDFQHNDETRDLRRVINKIIIVKAPKQERRISDSTQKL